MSLKKAGHKVENKNKVLSDVSDLVTKTARHSEQITRYELALVKLAQSAAELSAVWEGIDTELEPKITRSGSYPFHCSFDELSYGIWFWVEDIQRNIKKLREGV